MCCELDIALAAARALHEGACLLLFATAFFDAVIARESGARKTGALWIAAWVSGAAWFWLASVSMSGEWIIGMPIVWNQTAFGAVWKIRLGVGIAAWLGARTNRSPGIGAFLTAILLGSLAWAGHGQIGGTTHLWVDVGHLIAAGIWPAGLWPFWVWLRTETDRATMLRFSRVSLGGVLALGFSGIGNALFLIGSWPLFFNTLYGNVLAVKIGLFGLLIGISAVNFRLVRRNSSSIEPLRWNVAWECGIAAGTMILVGILGVLPPGNGR